jgi:hypothetical protein
MRVDVEWNANKGFVATAFELKHPIVALTLSGLNRDCRPCFRTQRGSSFAWIVRHSGSRTNGGRARVWSAARAGGSGRDSEVYRAYHR